MQSAGGSETAISARVRSWLAIGATFGFLGVALGAFGAHALGDVLDARGRDLWDKAVFYQLSHAIALLLVAVLAIQHPARRFAPSAAAFTLGIVVFSGTLYLLALGAPRWLGAVTPLGGVSFLLGWGWLVRTALGRPRAPDRD